MRYLLLLTLLTGCATAIPVKMNFPEAPKELMEPCSKLYALDQDAKLSDVAKSVVNNYTLYHQCSTLQQGWIDWYKAQKSIFESIK